MHPVVTVTDTTLSDGMKRKRAKPIHGICRDAEKLGVTRQHLQEVLTGKRLGSRELLARWEALQRRQSMPTRKSRGQEPKNSTKRERTT
jgi:hypothetical protein